MPECPKLGRHDLREVVDSGGLSSQKRGSSPPFGMGDDRSPDAYPGSRTYRVSVKPQAAVGK